MLRIELTASAARDLDEIWDFIAIENQAPAAAEVLVDEIDENLQRVAQFPSIGEAVTHLRANTRRLVIRRRYLLFYEANDTRILVLRVLHGARLIRPEDLAATPDQ